MNFGADPEEWRRVLDQANAGEITLDPDVGRGLDKVCDDYLTELGNTFGMIDQVRVLSGFGPFTSGQALEKKFSEKAAGTDQSLEAIIQKHIECVQLAKELVAKAISNFIEQNDDWASRFTGLETE